MHVNDRVAGQVTDDTDPAHSRAPAAVRLRALVLAHRPFAVLLAVAAALRVVVMLGYPSAMFFNDSYNYMTNAVTRSADIVRSDGYPLFLYVLLPFHGLALVIMWVPQVGSVPGVTIQCSSRCPGSSAAMNVPMC